MSTLVSLPNELLLMICNAVYPPGDDWLRRPNRPWERHERLATLAALMLTNRHLSTFAGVVLYDRAAKHHASLSLSWAAKRGHEGTLRKALAAGAPPDQTMRLQMTHDLWRYANETHQAAMQWENQDLEYWPAWSNRRIEDEFQEPRTVFSGEEKSAQWGREMTPTRTELDVFALALENTVVDPDTYYYDVNHGLVNSLMDAGHDPAAASEDNETEIGYPQIFETGDYLLREHTALHLAAREGHTDIVNILLDHGASADSPSRWFCPCQPPLGFWSRLLNAPAYRYGYERMDSISDDLVDPTIWSPLHAAICSSRIETAKCLISRGANITNLIPIDSDMASSYGALHQAAAAGHADLVGYILDTHPELNVDQPDQHSMTPFYHAYANGRWDSTVPLLLARGANINFRFRVRDAEEQCLSATPLVEACRLGRFEDAIKLIDLGADINMGLLDHSHETLQPPHNRAPARNAEATLLHLCCMDFSIDRLRYRMSAPIWRPAQTQTRSRPRIIAKLVAAGISVDVKWDPGDGNGITPLSVAVRHINTPAVEALLVAGADPLARDFLGRNALITAVGMPCDQRNIRRLDPVRWGLLPSHYRGSTLLRDYPDRWAMVRLLLDAGVPLGDRDAEGNTVLHTLFGGHDERPEYQWIEPRAERHILRLLISRGADPSLRNKAGASALRVAVQKGFLYAVQTIANNCRIDLMDAFPMQEIAAIIAAIPKNRQVPSDWSDEESSASDSDAEERQLSAESCRFLGAIVDIDRSGRLASNATFICSQLAGGGPPIRPPSHSMLEFAEILCSKGLEMGSFDSDTKMTLLRAAINAARWHMARALVREVPQSDIDAPDAHGQTLLSMVTSSRAGNPDFAIHLMEAGADIHHPLLVPQGGAPLKDALMHPMHFPIKEMLRKQPIRGNPQAIARRYLHWFVHIPWVACWPEESNPVGWRARDRALRALIAAGADPAEVDDTGNTPLSHLLASLVLKDEKHLFEMCHWIKPLSRGVDIHRQNKQGRSVAYYLRIILTQARFSQGDDVLVDLLDIDQPLEDGDPEIYWRR